MLQSLAPIDHLIYSSVSKITQGPIADADLAEARSDMNVKFWGSALTGKIISKYDIMVNSSTKPFCSLRPFVLTSTVVSFQKLFETD